MPRPHKIWWWKARKEWCVKIRNVRHHLGADKQEAQRKFHELMAQKGPVLQPESVVAVIDKFLDWCEHNRAEGTLKWYRERLQWFVDSLEDKFITVDELKPHHVQTWVDGKPGWADGMKRGAITAVVGAFNRAKKLGHIEFSPLAGMEKPAAGAREVVISPDEYDEILQFVKGCFRDAIVTAWETGCRPEELVRVEAAHVDLEGERWVFPVKKSKGKKLQRVVYMTDNVLEIVKRLIKKHPSGPLYRNARGEPWTSSSLNCCFTRLQADMGRASVKKEVPEAKTKERMKEIAKRRQKKGKPALAPYDLRYQAKKALEDAEARKHAPKYFLYAFRHSYITNALKKKKTDPITLQHLVGHKDLTMISKIYAKVQQDTDYMRAAAKQVVQ